MLAGGFAWAAAKLAGGGSSSSSPTAPAGNTANAETPVVGRKPRDEDEKDGKVKGEGDTKDNPPKKQPTKEELANFKDNIFLNTTRAATDAYLDRLDAQGVDTKEMRAHAEAQRAKGVRDLTAGEIQVKRLNKELNDLKIELDKASTIAQDNGLQTEGPNPLQQQAQRREEIKQKIAEKEAEISRAREVGNGGNAQSVGEKSGARLSDSERAELKRLQDKLKKNTATPQDREKFNKLSDKLNTIEVHGQRDPKDFSFLDGVENPIEAIALIREKYGKDVADEYARGVDNQKMGNFWRGLADSTILSPLTAYDWMMHSPKDAKAEEPSYTLPEDMKGKTDAEKEAYLKGKKLEDRKGISNTVGTTLGVGTMIAGGLLLSTLVGGAMGVTGILGGIKSKLSNLTRIERTVVKDTGKKSILNAAGDALPDVNRIKGTNPIDQVSANGKNPVETKNLVNNSDNTNLNPDGTKPINIDPKDTRPNNGNPANQSNELPNKRPASNLNGADNTPDGGKRPVKDNVSNSNGDGVKINEAQAKEIERKIKQDQDKIRKENINKGLIEENKKKNYIESIDTDIPEFKTGAILENGFANLVFKTKLITPEGKEIRSNVLRGDVEFRKVVEYFGDRLKGINGSWHMGISDLKDNAQQFNDYIKSNYKEGVDIKKLQIEAAKNTWTGKQAIKNGFTEVKIVSIGNPINGEYKDIEVKFYKPKEVKQ